RAFVESVGQRNAKEFPAKRRNSATSVVTLHEAVVGRVTKRALLVLLAAIGFALLSATANLVNLLLNRAAARARECSIRSAPGLAWRITRQDIREALQQSGNAVSSGKASQRYREALVVAQVALSLMLLIAAGLLVKSFGRLQHVDPGVRTANLLSFELAVSGP